MNETSVPQLLMQGLAVTAWGLGLVFLGLGLLWGLMALLTRIFRPGVEESPAPEAYVASEGQAAQEAAAGAALTAERSRVAAIVAGALLAHALPWQPNVPAGPAFEHGRTAPSWVSTNRARILRPWQPPVSRN